MTNNTLVVGHDGRLHIAEEHLREDLSVCDRIVAARRVSPAEGRFTFWQQRLCPQCFPDGFELALPWKE